MSLLSEIANRLGYFDDAEFLKKVKEFQPDDGDLRINTLLFSEKNKNLQKTMEQVNILCDKYPENLNYQAQRPWLCKTGTMKKLFLY